MTYAVIDVETTGLRPSWHDRVVEIAIVQVDAAGAIESEWCTLVNPQRDLGPQHIHGISAAEARQAPPFKELAGSVAERLAGRVLVAHNWAFDSMFLAAEFERIGADVPVDADNGLCTMVLAGQFLPQSGRALASCCRAAGVTLTNAHSALHDARAAAELLGHYLSIAGAPPPWAHRLRVAPDWPPFPPATIGPARRRAEGRFEPHFLSRLVEELPRTHKPNVDAYLDVLDRALLDRHISVVEAEALVSVADSLGLDRAELVELHEQYLQALATVAVLDNGSVSAGVRDDLTSVATLLGLDGGSVDGVVRTAQHAITMLGGEPARPTRRLYLRHGDIVVFTGDTGEPREMWEARATAAGLRVGQNVTLQTRLLVAADPDTMSGKAAKAAQYGIPIVHPKAFLRMLPTDL
ncbi:exonuclease domain-containing protein [Allorhizocola rhizosphaerae]|uniref:exonuclease domain-containing protein n=1 Tax=Allorhizocola rhizosphaerae TaxID=1872709 RepID=UPI000E3E6964|nr:exonuclease domain-containing protein [Allorhizocola rhizosphaerae]